MDRRGMWEDKAHMAWDLRRKSEHLAMVIKEEYGVCLLGRAERARGARRVHPLLVHVLEFHNDRLFRLVFATNIIEQLRPNNSYSTIINIIRLVRDL